MNNPQKIPDGYAVIVTSNLAALTILKICYEQKIKIPKAICISSERAGFYGVFKL